MRRFRFWLGRLLIHAGLRVFPPGRVRDEVTGVLRVWGDGVRRELAK